MFSFSRARRLIWKEKTFLGRFSHVYRISDQRPRRRHTSAIGRPRQPTTTSFRVAPFLILSYFTNILGRNETQRKIQGGSLRHGTAVEMPMVFFLGRQTSQKDSGMEKGLHSLHLHNLSEDFFFTILLLTQLLVNKLLYKTAFRPQKEYNFN